MPAGYEAVSIDPNALPYSGTIDERYQSYNIEMVEVTGGEFWAPYGDASPLAAESAASNRLAHRPPLDLKNARLRILAAELGPAFVRVSGTWANSTYFAETDPEPTSPPPPGFKSVLTRSQWAGVIDFARAVDAQIVTSFAISDGTRDGVNAWTPDLAGRWLQFTSSIGGRFAAAEFMNEPNIAAVVGGNGGAPSGYTAADYGRDFATFKSFVAQSAPEMKILGPGSVAETPGPWQDTLENFTGVLSSSELLDAAGAGLNAFSYHHYGAASPRCAHLPQTAAAAALTEEWLARTSLSCDFYDGLRKGYNAELPLWLTETAEAGCGGNIWAGTFLDSFRYLDQLGRLARAGVQVVMHNTLAASDYGLLNEADFTPKPNYWAALLWHRMMGTTVLNPGVPIQQGLHLYAHCHPRFPGGVTLLAINNDRSASRTIYLPAAAQRSTLSAEHLDAAAVKLNGQSLALGRGDALPRMLSATTEAGEIVLAPATITFLEIPSANNPACR